MESTVMGELTILHRFQERHDIHARGRFAADATATVASDEGVDTKSADDAMSSPVRRDDGDDGSSDGDDEPLVISITRAPSEAGVNAPERQGTGVRGREARAVAESSRPGDRGRLYARKWGARTVPPWLGAAPIRTDREIDASTSATVRLTARFTAASMSSGGTPTGVGRVSSGGAARNREGRIIAVASRSHIRLLPSHHPIPSDPADTFPRLDMLAVFFFALSPPPLTFTSPHRPHRTPRRPISPPPPRSLRLITSAPRPRATAARLVGMYVCTASGPAGAL